VFYTAHGFHFHKGAPLKNWLIYYPLEKWLSKYTDALITINKEDYERAKHKFEARRVEYIPGVGLDIDKFKNVVVNKITKREEIGVNPDSFVVLSVGELNKNKNHEIVIRAIANLNNPNVHYVICGKGPLESYLNNLAIELGIGKNVHLLGFRRDIPEICKVSDIFAFPSLREGLPVSVMEAMAVGMPILGSEIRGNIDLIINDKGGYIFNPKDEEELGKKIAYMFEKYTDIALQFKKYNQERISNYSENVILDNLKTIYNLYPE
jgi:glycosyltransferase involved in cell wall biosynthesis